MEDNQQKRKSREQQRRAGAGERGKLCVYHSLLSVVKVVRHKRHMSEFIICRPPFCCVKPHGYVYTTVVIFIGLVSLALHNLSRPLILLIFLTQ